MVVVSDMARSVKFYRDTLGLPLKYETREWTEFQTGKTTLALHVGRKPEAVRAAGSGEPIAGTCSIGFTVSDLEKTFRDLQSKGAHFVMPPKAREGEGIKLAVCVDPDGLPVSLSQTVQETHRAEMPAEPR